MKSHEEVMNLARALADAFVAFVDAVVAADPIEDVGQGDPLPSDGGGIGNTDDGDPSGDQPSDSPPVTVDPPPIDDPAPIDQGTPEPEPVAANVVRLLPGATFPAHPGTGNTIVYIQNGTQASYWKQQPNDPETGEPIFKNTHGGGDAIYLGGCLALFVGGNTTATQIWPATPVLPPDGIPPLPTKPTPPSTSTPPTESPSAPTATFSLGHPAEVAKMAINIPGVGLFSGADAISCGDYTNPRSGQVQRNRKVVSGDLTIFFRPDVESEYMEIVVEWGNIFNSAPYDREQYAAEIIYDGEVIATPSLVSRHWHLSRWRWQSAPRPILRTPAELIAAKLIPPYGLRTNNRALPRAVPGPQPMGLSGLALDMGQTGQRDDIGPVTEVAAAYIATGDATALASVRSQAEASGTYPWHLRDPNTGSVLIWDDYPNSSVYSDQSKSGKPSMYISTGMSSTQGRPRVESAHPPAISYLMYLMTGDLYHLEEQQFQAGYFLGAYPNHNTLLPIGQTRAYGWVMRDLVYTVIATPEVAPPGLLPKAYWKRILDKNLAWAMTNLVNATEARRSTFFSGPSPTVMGFWQEDWFASVLGFTVWAGFESWRPVLNWKLQSNWLRSNGQSGWPRTRPTIYYAQDFEAVPSITLPPYAKDWARQAGAPAAGGVSADAGEWNVRITSDTTFDVIRPSGTKIGSGTIGKVYADNKLSFLVPERVEDFTILVTPVLDWANLARVNEKYATADGKLDVAFQTDYLCIKNLADQWGKKVGAPGMAEVSDWLSDQLESRKSIPWRMSLAA